MTRDTYIKEYRLIEDLIDLIKRVMCETEIDASTIYLLDLVIKVLIGRLNELLKIRKSFGFKSLEMLMDHLDRKEN